MIYLDNSATSYPKPRIVCRSAESAMRLLANPGRSGHDLSMRASETIFRTRKTAAEFFNASSEEKVIFTLNCTVALNIVIKGLLKSGDHVVISDLEHNAVMRPLEKMKELGVTCTQAKVYYGDHDKTVDSFRRAINSRTRLVLCTHASNVWGMRLPVERIAALSHEYGIPIAVDAAQSTGVLPIDMKDSGVDFLCAAGHKGLYGPMGTGMLVIGEGVTDSMLPASLTEGGTGSNSLSIEQPTELPDRFESGTPNLSGIAGLKAGIDFVSRNSLRKIAGHEYMLMKRLHEGLSRIRGVTLYLPAPEPRWSVPVMSFNIGDRDSEECARLLDRRGIAVRAGLHCSPAAHRKMNTLGQGAIRVSPSFFTAPAEIDRLITAVAETERSLR